MFHFSKGASITMELGNRKRMAVYNLEGMEGKEERTGTALSVVTMGKAPNQKVECRVAVLMSPGVN